MGYVSCVEMGRPAHNVWHLVGILDLNFLNDLFIFMCMSILPASVSVHHVYPQRPEVGVDPLELESQTG